MRSRFLVLCTAALFTGASAMAVADDGAITNKSMSQTIQLPATGVPGVPEAEHAFTDMMGFYVPAQAASGAPAGELANGLITYNNIDDVLVEELPVAKPLVNVFIYGPAVGVEDTAFAHSFMDTYAAVSLDDGETWKKTNLSNSADLSSFNLDTDHIVNPGGDSLPSDHDELLGEEDEDDDESAYHALGYQTPYTSECTECHGVALQGTASVSSCYSCHENNWDEDAPTDLGPVITEAEWEGEDRGGKLEIDGDNAASKAEVSILNAITGQEVAMVEAEDDGRFEAEVEFDEEPPCVVAAEYLDPAGAILRGPAVAVIDDDTDEPITECEGQPVDLTEYPGGAYNVFHATAGNKTLVAWPSRFCERGQPAYQMTTDTNPDEERLDTIVNFISGGDTELGVPALEGFNMADDLYLLDAFGVAGRQGSIDFADEGYPQAGVVPYGCVWTARGILLPGDNPQTDAVEESHMVWTQAERLTSGRRDPNRIEVRAVKGAGFVITWQEDPEGLRPGQGLGPGEGWSGAVAHSQTDIWYSYINEEYFDIVETTDNTTVPINVLDHDLTQSGRPQVFVPMAVPMRLSNNAKCNPPGTVTSGGGEDDLYCTEAAVEFGLKNQCAATVTILTGNPDSTGGQTETEICVADSDGDGVADLPNRANTAATRPRLGLQGYDASADDKSAWVIVAAEESKGLGKFFFEPDTDGNGLAEPCDEAASEEEGSTCSEEIGKNQWYYSFDMGTPDTSAGIGEPNSLVENLVSQGNMLNQGEVYWETGELYGLMDTAEMGEDPSDPDGLYGEYNFQILNTEIARRASLLVQPVAKAVASANGLVAIPSWKQGPMRQGGPADTMLRRIVLPDGYVPEEPAECLLNENIDAERPVVDFARYFVLRSGNGRIELQVDGLDGDLTTEVQTNNAATDEQIVRRIYDETDPWTETTEDFYYRIAVGPGSNRAIPCAVQVADVDVDGSLEFGPWTPVENAPDDCDGPIPPDCLDEDGNPVAVTAATTPGIEVNPYAFENMACVDYLIEPGANPYYPGGVCRDPATNLSGVVPDTCIDDDTGGEVPCPTVDFTTSTYGIGDTNPILQGVVQGEGNKQRVLTWHQCPSDGNQTAGDITAVTCDMDDRDDEFVNLRDQSWYNPLDISKGHRGFIDGDFVQFLYAWSPNWRLNAKGTDRYDLYVRRSFDGGETWTTTPIEFEASDGNSYTGDGTVTCESYRSDTTGTSGDLVEPKVCYGFAAGGAEHARNITQHKAMRITTLDPRYAPTKATIADGCTDGLFLDPTVIEDIFTCDDESETVGDDRDSDLRDPSRYFMVFETGDNTTVQAGEAEPLDLFYGRAEGFGDDYVVWTETDTESADTTLCYPSDPHGVDISGTIVGSGFCNEFDNMNTGGDTHSSEANLESNPDGSKLYGVWAQWVFDGTGEEVDDADAMARRIWWIDDYISLDNSYSLPGTNQTTE